MRELRKWLKDRGKVGESGGVSDYKTAPRIGGRDGDLEQGNDRKEG